MEIQFFRNHQGHVPRQLFWCKTDENFEFRAAINEWRVGQEMVEMPFVQEGEIFNQLAFGTSGGETSFDLLRKLFCSDQDGSDGVRFSQEVIKDG